MSVSDDSKKEEKIKKNNEILDLSEDSEDGEKSEKFLKNQQDVNFSDDEDNIS